MLEITNIISNYDFKLTEYLPSFEETDLVVIRYLKSIGFCIVGTSADFNPIEPVGDGVRL